MPTFYDLMKFAATGIASPDMTAYDKARALAAFGGGKTQTLTDVPPLSFKANGKPLVSLSMLGNGSQTGTPTHDAPIMPDFCGKLVGTDWTIPITCAGQTTPVYLGQTPTVRRIKKMVLTGTETWYVSGSWGKDNTAVYYMPNMDGYNPSNNSVYIICDHYLAESRNGIYGNDYECAGFTGVASLTFRVSRQYADTKANFISYLAAQYQAGTPVTVWYILAEPETAIVNEPLCKIGDYADELHSEDAGVTIPTAKGQNTLTVDTDLQPSEMTITYKG